MLRAKHITVRRARSLLLDGVDAEARPGELLVIAGMNGAGKTTLLRVLSGELAPDGGEVSWGGKLLKSFRHKELARVRAYLSQRTLVTLPFRAIEVVELGVNASGSDGADTHSLARAALEQCGVAHLEERLIDTLSGGEQQRVHWARVIAQLGAQTAPPGEAVKKAKELTGKCLLLDEPISALDLAHQHEMLALARSLVARGCAVIAALHDLNLSAEYGDRMLLLSEGKVAAFGTPHEVLTPRILKEAFGLRVRVEPSPVSGSPCVFVEPHATPC